VLSLDPTETIAAVSSPPGSGFRGIVRLSGPEAWAIALAGFEPADADAGADAPVALRSPGARRRAGQLRVDGLRPLVPVTIALWPEPRTYTGQPLAEIHLIGAVPLVQQVLAQCLARGARPAAPGEFTLRAFLAGRLDLTRAEAVLGVIEAATPAQLDAALEQLAGGLAGPITRLRDGLLDVLAHLEANLDFVDEADVTDLGRAALAASLTDSAAEVTALAQRLQGRDRPEGHPRVVLAGPPNAGKSRLFNALIGREHALVSPRAGTTRDYLAVRCDCDGLTIELIDTAGNEPVSASVSGTIAAQAQDQRAVQVARADLILACRSADTPAPAPPPHGPEVEAAALDVWTKADLTPLPEPIPGTLSTSAATGAGLAALRTAIARSLRTQPAEGDLLASTGARCRESLLRAGQALEAASATLLHSGGDELVAIDLRQALDELGKVVGAVVTDDILDRIFRRFCIGK
jgi:tRNA modification GTPase